MMSLEKYLKDPCAALSIPYWKAKSVSVPKNMKIVHDLDFDESDLNQYSGERYFRLWHGLKEVAVFELEGYDIKTATENDFGKIAEIINRSYTEIKVDEKRLKEMTETPVYVRELWVLVTEKASGETVACAIADFDREAKELVIEWVQVLPEHRKKGIGKFMVNEILCRMAGKADFATVSGKTDDKSKPEMLYRACGFEGNDVWHIMRRK